MYLTKRTNKNGDVRLYFAETIRIPNTKKNKIKIVKSLGLLSELKLIYDDPIKHFTEVANKNNEEKKLENETINLSLNPNNKASDCNGSKNLMMGSSLLSCIYHSLNIHSVFKKYLTKNKNTNHLNKIFMLLTYLRILNPGSKKFTFESKEILPETFNFKKHDVYSSLKHFDTLKNEIILEINNNISNLIKIDKKVSHYDLTNFYVYTKESDDENKQFLKRGYSKEHSQYPIIQMDLLSDANGTPLNYKLYNGNRPDVSTLNDFIKEQSQIFKFKKSVIVGDAGIISAKNIIQTLISSHGYILKKSMRKLSESEYNMFKEVIKPKIEQALKLREDLNHFVFSVVIDTDFTYIDNNKKVTKTLPQKYLFRYSRKSARLDKHVNDDKIGNALEIINNSKKYKKKISKDSSNLISLKTSIVDENTGEVLEVDNNFEMNEKMKDRLREIEGYSLLVTSETNVVDTKIIEAYRNQYLIEQNFRITKSEIEARPIYLTLDKHINAHFLSCFTALVITKILYELLDRKYSTFEIIESIRKYESVYIIDNVYKSIGYNEIIAKLSEIFGLDNDYDFLKPANIKKIMGDSKKIKKIR